jgi:pyruvate dehydrogenase (quinone)
MVKLEMLVDGAAGIRHGPRRFRRDRARGRASLPPRRQAAEVRDAIKDLLAHDGPALLDVGTDPNALSIPPNITAAQVKGFALAASKTVLSGGVGKMLQLAKSNLRNVPRP